MFSTSLHCSCISIVASLQLGERHALERLFKRFAPLCCNLDPKKYILRQKAHICSIIATFMFGHRRKNTLADVIAWNSRWKLALLHLKLII